MTYKSLHRSNQQQQYNRIKIAESRIKQQQDSHDVSANEKKNVIHTAYI